LDAVGSGDSIKERRDVAKRKSVWGAPVGQMGGPHFHQLWSVRVFRERMAQRTLGYRQEELEVVRGRVLGPLFIQGILQRKALGLKERAFAAE